MKRALGVLVLATALGACGHGAGSASPHGALAPLSAPLTLVAAGGEVDAKTDGAGFLPRTPGQTLLHPTALRARGGSATFRIGDAASPRGSVWLKDGATVEIGEDETGAIVVVAEAGQARVRVDDGRVRVLAREGTPSSNDLLVWHDEGGSRAAATAEDLAAAEWSFAFDAKKEPAGIGSLETRSDDGAVTKLRVAKMDVTAKSLGDYAETEVSEVFVNDGDRRTEGTFRYPLPEGAFLVGLAMEIDGRLMEGELVERAKAEKVYESVVDSMRDPALLEWESGSVFKLRVFPLEPHAEKRVVLRYVAPLRRTPTGLELAFRTASNDGPRAPFALRVSLDGKSVFDDSAFVPGREIDAPALPAPARLREVRKDGVYTAAEVRPDWSKVPAPPKVAQRDVVVVVDTSRSTLEERPLELDALRLVLGELRAQDRFLVVAADVEPRDQASDFVAATPRTVDAAVAFVAATEADGASDLGAALRHVAAHVTRAKSAGRKPEVIYLGDGAATWGETDPDALAKIADTSLGDAPLHAMLLGAGADVAGMRHVVGARGGRLGAPRTELEARKLAVGIAHAFELRRIDHARVSAGDNAALFPDGERTIFEGEPIAALVQTPPGAPEPTALLLSGTAGGAEVHQSLALPATGRDVERVGQRWARERITALEAEGPTKKDDAVKVSLAFGLMSHDTSFLVLESEEQYARFDIERKNAKRAADGAPTVTGADLESLSGDRARLDPDHIQPGDPEVRIFAPEDARAVVVTLPTGETKLAELEPELHAWTTRFLIDKDTPDGTYDVGVRVVRADGTVENETLHYVVDTQKPKVTVKLRRSSTRPGSYEISATQEISEGEVAHAVAPGLRGSSLADDRLRFAEILTDAQHVEVALPDGQTVALTAIRLGEFRGTWTPRGPYTGSVHARVVTTDRALNQDVREMDLALP